MFAGGTHITATQYTMHQSGSGSWPVGSRDAASEATRLIKTVESVYSQSMSHADEAKKREHDSARTQQELQRVVQDNEKLRAKLQHDERVRLQDTTMREELLENRLRIEAISESQRGFKTQIKEYGAIIHNMKEATDAKRKQLADYSSAIDDIKEKQKDRKELRRRNTLLSRNLHGLKQQLADSERTGTERAKALEAEAQRFRTSLEEKDALARDKAAVQGLLDAKGGDMVRLGAQKEAVVNIFVIEMKELDTQLLSMGKEAATREEQLRNASARMEANAARISELSTQHAEKAQIADQYKARNDVLQASAASYQSQLDEKEQQRVALAEQHSAGVKELEEKLAGLREHSSAESERAAAAARESQKQMAQLEREKTDVLESAAKSKKADEAEKKQLQASHEGQLEELRARCGRIEEAAQKADGEHKSVASERDAQIEQLKKELGDAQKQHSDDKDQMQRQNQQQLLNLQGQLNEAGRAKKQEADEAAQTRQKLEAQLAALREESDKKLSAEQSQAREVQGELEAAKAELGEAGERATAAEARVAELERQLQLGSRAAQPTPQRARQAAPQRPRAVPSATVPAVGPVRQPSGTVAQPAQTR